MLKKTIFVSDIQPVLPAVSGGRLRIVGLWGNTTEQFPVTYVGTYDSPGKMYCKKVMGENAIQIIEPCDKKIFEAIEECNAYFPALSMFDILFPHLSEYYQAFIETSRCHMQKSDIIVFSHPWTYNALYPFIDDQLVIYDAHNVESYLRAQMLLEYQYRNTGPVLLRKIIEVEYQLLHRCDLILACSQRDSSQFQALFEVDSSKILQVPNGAFVLQNFALSNSVKYRIKKRLRLSRQYIGIFSGSNYGPNIDALQFINAIAPLHPTVDFIITGDMTHLLPQQPISDNVHLLGLLEQSAFETALRISDFALNPIFSGSGSNVKLYTYMSAGLPVITTELGARGLDSYENNCTQDFFIVSNKASFSKDISRLLSNPSLMKTLADRSKEFIHKHYNWREISRRLCQAISLRYL